MTGGIVAFAVAVLLVTWALTQLIELLESSWPLLLGIVIVAAAGAVGTAVWRRRDYW